MSLATLSMAGASGLQAILYLSRFGVTGRTDGFFVAFALYTSFGVFGQSLRLTSVPLLVEPRPRLTARQFGAVLLIISAPVLVACVAFPGALADVLAPGLEPAFRAVTRDALPLLGVAAVLQLWAAGGATVLAVRGRFASVARSYSLGAAAGLASFVALAPSTKELSLGWSMLVSAVVTAALMLSDAWLSGSRSRRALPADSPPWSLFPQAGFVLGRTSIYLALNVLFVITLGFASHSTSGDTTVLSYAYLFVSYLVAGTGMAVGMSRIPDLTRSASSIGAAIAARTITQGFRYAVLFVAPALGALIAAGAPLAHELVPSSIDDAGVRTLRVFVALLAAWTLAALAVNLLLPVLFALGRPILVNVLAGPLVLVHAVATAAGSYLFGVEGVVAATFIAPGCLVAVLLVAACRREARLVATNIAADALRFGGLAAAAFGAGVVAGDALGGGLGATLIAGATGVVLYAVGARVAAPRQLTVLLSALRPARS